MNTSQGIMDDFQTEWRKPNNITFRIIFINVSVWVVLFLLSAFGQHAGVMSTVYNFTRKTIYLSPDLMTFILRPWTLFTYAFAHEGFFHILFNMLIFYWFSIILKNYLGSMRVLAIYLYGAAVGGVFYLLLYNLIPAFGAVGSSAGLLGASGAVYAIVTATGTLLPEQRIHLLFVGPVKLKYVALIYVGLSFLMFLGGSNAGGNIAHLGGALMGYLFIQQYQDQNDLSTPLVQFINYVEDLFKEKPKMKATKGGAGKKARKEKKSAASAGTSDIDQAEVDRILDKISESGYEKLTKEEKQVLFRASQKK